LTDTNKDVTGIGGLARWVERILIGHGYLSR
jgi:hypothetical protein